MKHQQSIYEKFMWKVENFSRLKNLSSEDLFSEPFVLCGYPWRICLFPQGNKQEGYLSIFLEAMQTANMSKGWSRNVNFSLVVYDQFDSQFTITEEDIKILVTTLSMKSKGNWVFGIACIIGVEVCLLKAINEKQLSQTGLTASLTSSGQTGHTKVEVPNLETLSPAPTLDCIEPTKHIDVELFSASNSNGELIDFRGLGQIQKAFVPLLEEVCSHNPSLIECQQKKSLMFTEWAFTALGRVLYFLKTRKVKDMNDIYCKELQTLLEELEPFGFNLTLLKTHVQSTLGMKSYVEKAMQVEKLKENAVALKLETEKLKAKLVAVEVNLEMETEKLDAERDLLKAKGLQVRDLDAELGYGSLEAKGM